MGRSTNSLFLSIPAITLAISCTTGPCRTHAQGGESVSPNSVAPTSVAGATSAEQPAKIKVYRTDGSKQCEPNSGISLEKAKKELEALKITVFFEASTKDGGMHATVCGGATGNIHVFQILDSDFEAAKKKGYQLWKDETNPKSH